MHPCNLFVLFRFMLIMLFLTACKQSGKKQDENIAADPASLHLLIQKNIRLQLNQANVHTGIIHDSFQLNFFKVLDRSYALNDDKPVWSTNGKWAASAEGLIHFLGHSLENGLFKEDYHFSGIQAIKRTLDEDSVKRMNAALWSQAELLFTDAFMHLIQDLAQGRLQPDSQAWKNDKEKYDHFFAKNLTRLMNGEIPDSIFKSVQPVNPGYWSLKRGIPNFLDSMDTRTYTFVNYPYKKDDKNDSLLFVKKLLARLKESAIIDQLQDIDSSKLADAIRKYQLRKKINPDGKITASLIKHLNNTDIEKYFRIAVTLDRYKQLPLKMPETYIWVNLPGYYLHVGDADTIVFTSKIICGKPETATPFITSMVSDLVIYPTWTVPSSIIRKEMLPALKKNAGYLNRKGLNLYNKDGELIDPYTVNWEKYSKGIPYKIQQGSGDGNALGVIKFNFENPFAVYLHDTNQRYLFKKQMRALSHGCVRVQDWEKLAFFIARKDSVQANTQDSLNYNTDSITSWIANKQKHHIPVQYQIPIFIRYFGCEAVNGSIKFYDDIYGEDKKAKADFFAKSKYSF